MTICLTSSDPKFDEIYLSNFATINVLDLLRRIPVWDVFPTSVAATMPCRYGRCPTNLPTSD